MDDGILVTVRRYPQDWQTAEYELSEIWGLRWDSVSGGVQRSTPHRMVMGYVWCDGMVSGEVAHSCSHGPPPHEIKVCVVKKYNKAHWKQILERVGPKPG